MTMISWTCPVVGVDVLGALRGERLRVGLGGRAAAGDLDAVVVVGSRVDLVGRVRRVAVDAARAEDDGEVLVGAADLLGADDGPVDALLVEDLDQAGAEGHLAREEARGLRGGVAPGAGVDVLVGLDLLALGGLADQRHEGVVEGEDDDVEARLGCAERAPAAGRMVGAFQFGE
jgi:hypothetical protein